MIVIGTWQSNPRAGNYTAAVTAPGLMTVGYNRYVHYYTNRAAKYITINITQTATRAPTCQNQKASRARPAPRRARAGQKLVARRRRALRARAVRRQPTRVTVPVNVWIYEVPL